MNLRNSTANGFVQRTILKFTVNSFFLKTYAYFIEARVINWFYVVWLEHRKLDKFRMRIDGNRCGSRGW